MFSLKSVNLHKLPPEQQLAVVTALAAVAAAQPEAQPVPAPQPTPQAPDPPQAQIYGQACAWPPTSVPQAPWPLGCNRVYPGCSQCTQPVT